MNTTIWYDRGKKNEIWTDVTVLSQFHRKLKADRCFNSHTQFLFIKYFISNHFQNDFNILITHYELDTCLFENKMLY